MFTINNIIIKQNYLDSSFENNLEKRKEDLFSLCNKIINEMGITSLTRVTIEDIDFFTTENGSAIFIPFSNETLSTIKLSRKTFIQFDNESNPSLRDEALATIYHEFYHVYDHENICKLGANKEHAKINDNPYYKIGEHYWSEFYAYYKTKHLYMTEHPYNEFESIYSKINGQIPSEDTIKAFFYILSAIIAYNSDANYISKMNDIISFRPIQKSKSYIELASELNNILQEYPSNISLDAFVRLGKKYLDVLDNFNYECTFKGNKMTFKKLPFERNLIPENPFDLYGKK